MATRFHRAPVLGWIALAKRVFDRNQQRAPWRWFHARYFEWTESESQRREKIDWTHGIDGLRWRCFDVVPLRDSTVLWQEGEAVWTCLSTCGAEPAKRIPPHDV